MLPVEGQGTRCEIGIDAAPDQVWTVVSDISVPARRSPELRRVEWLDGATAPAVGARFAGYNANEFLGDWRSVSQVVVLEEARAFAWAVMDADGRFGDPCTDPARPGATWRFDLEPNAAGTRLGHSVTLGPARSGLVLAIERRPERRDRIVAGRLRSLHEAMEATLREIKALAEAPA